MVAKSAGRPAGRVGQLALLLLALLVPVGTSPDGQELDAPQALLDTATGSQLASTVADAARRLSAPASQPSEPAGRLPTWFDFDLFKRLHGKRYASRRLDELHRRVYLRTALRVLEQRVQFRLGRLGSLATLNELSDLTGGQLEALRLRAGAPAATASGPAPRTGGVGRGPAMPECCSYDQVYERIIALLSAGLAELAGQPAPGPSLARALMDELEQKPLLDEDDRQVDEAGPGRGLSSPSGRPNRPINGSSLPGGAGQDAGGPPVAVKAEDADDWLAAGSWPAAAKSNLAASGAPATNLQRQTAQTSAAPAPDNQMKLAADDGPALTDDGPATVHQAGPLPLLSMAGVASRSADRDRAHEKSPASELDQRRQFARQLSESPMARQLSRRLSAHYGEPVSIRVQALD